jgi:phage baseplate assembly protein W
MALYKGFSFKNWKNDKSFTLTDVDIVKRDILNHIFTRKGERVGQRGFGTILQDLIFEPFDQDTITLASDQIRSVIDFDPRVELLSDDDYVVYPDFDKSFLFISARLYYIELDLTDILHINVEFEI